MNSFFKLGLRVEDRAFYGKATVVAVGLRVISTDKEAEAAWVLLDEAVIEQVDDPVLAKLSGTATTAFDRILVTKENFTEGTWSVLPDHDRDDDEWTADMIREAMEAAVKAKEKKVLK